MRCYEDLVVLGPCGMIGLGRLWAELKAVVSCKRCIGLNIGVRPCRVEVGRIRLEPLASVRN